MLFRRTFLPIVLPVLMACPAWGGLVEPGQTSSRSDAANVDSIDGEIIKRRYVAFPMRGSDVIGRVIAGVARDTQSRQLSFFYQFANYNRAEFKINSLQIHGFDGFDTDLSTFVRRQQETPLLATRSGDGSSVDFIFDPDGKPLDQGGASVTMIIRTNATEFDENGMLSVNGIAGFRGEDEAASGLLRSFAPAGTALEAPNAAPPPVMAPLPPAVWTGLAGMAGTVLYALRARRIA